MIYSFEEYKHQVLSPGELLLSYGYPSEALPYLESEERKQTTPGTAVNVGLAYRCLGMFDLAEQYYELASLRDPEFPPLYFNRGILAEDKGNFEEAEKGYEAAHKVAPSAKTCYRLATAYMRRGEFGKAMPLWESGRIGHTYNPIADVPILTNEAMGTSRESWNVFAFREGGYGDTFWLARYLKQLNSLGGDLHLGLWKEQKELMKIQACGLVEDTMDSLHYDFYLPFMSTLECFCENGVLQYYTPVLGEPYICWPIDYPLPPDALREPVIGVCWKAAGQGVVLNTRNATLDDLEPLKDVNASFVSLQYGECPDWMTQVDVTGGWHDTASVINVCDYVISVDTAVAHLAGAMGIPTLISLPMGSDWKWGFGSVTPWYPNVKLYRAKQDPLSLADTFEAIAEDLT